MTVKFTGKQWNNFCAEEWPDAWWYEEEEVWIDGVLQKHEISVKETASVKLIGGAIYTEESMGASGTFTMSLESYARKWLKTQATASFVVEAPKELADTVKAAVKKAGGKIVGG